MCRISSIYASAIHQINNDMECFYEQDLPYGHIGGNQASLESNLRQCNIESFKEIPHRLSCLVWIELNLLHKLSCLVRSKLSLR
jgi:hypothetical protein